MFLEITARQFLLAIDLVSFSLDGVSIYIIPSPVFVWN